MTDPIEEEESYFAGAYWGARKESSEECAARLEAFFRRIAHLDPAFARWFRQGKSRADALKHPIDATLVDLEKLIRRGKDRVVEELGYRVGAWNGATDDEDGCSLKLTCGGSSPRVSNSCVLELPSRGPNAARVLTEPVLRGLMKSMATAWEPDFAVVMSSTHLRMLRDNDPAEIWPGWLIYLSRHRGTVPPLPAPVSIESVEDKGTLIVLTRERFTASKSEHVTLAERVRERLDREGLLKSLQVQS
ncbi:immunity 52 family protein [Myxococcus sp. K15C18031901]|uniref:immunity 52 family protein n=1 Tax=Myxococcus dinghuensis TaxID=2906761 RepID=UPI0020A78CAD|nr:immunity 52 family protein [Myxococcus dinghuensis]MCP3100254.1 immunity 52 family protein [Myxococcus dinghuensis]